MKKLISYLLLTIISFNSVAGTLIDNNSTNFNNNKKINLEDSDQFNSKKELEQLHNGRNPTNTNPDFKQFGLGKAGDVATDYAEGFLKNYGTAKINISGGDNFQSGSIDLLVPVYDLDKHLFFTQIGARRSNLLTEDYRTTINIGAGYRYFTEDNWMYGINSFYDVDVTRNHQRMGVGAEIWTDNLKLSANSYMRLSNWKQSPSLETYQERPANGFDVRAEGYLSNYPQLGGKLMYEKYYGDEVGLFGENTRQKDPSAVTLGLIYNPFPLLNVGLDYRVGQDGKNDTKLNIGMKYQIGVPMSQQLQSANLNESRKIKFTRTALVERNNEIVLEYRVTPIGSIKLPNSINGNSGQLIQVPVVVSSKLALKNFTWSGTASPYIQAYNNGSYAVLTLPPHSSTTSNNYTLQLSATDTAGRTVTSNTLNVIVDPVGLILSKSKATANADGIDSVIFTATLRDKNNAPLTNRNVTWIIRNGVFKSIEAKTDANGQAKAVVTSSDAANVEVDVTDTETSTVITDSVAFIEETAMVDSLTSTLSSLVANGSTSTTISAIIKDSNGALVGAGVPVNWITTSGALSATSTLTNASGVATVTLISGVIAQSVTVNAKATDTGKNLTIVFIGDQATAKLSSLTTDKEEIGANTITNMILSADIKDVNGNSVGAGVPVNWTTTAGTLASSTTLTNTNGIATVILTSGTLAQSVVITAQLDSNSPILTKTIKFIPNKFTARVVSVTSDKTTAFAGSSENVTLTSLIKDANGNLVGAGIVIRVGWTSTDRVVYTAEATSNENSEAIVVVTAPAQIGTITYFPRVVVPDNGDWRILTAVTYTSNPATRIVADLTSSATTVTANGTSTVTLRATLKDMNGTALGAGLPVNWTTSAGTLASATTLTGSSGVATVVLTTSTLAQTVTFGATAGGNDTGMTNTLSFIANTSTIKAANLTSSGTSAIAGTGTQILFTATMVDANNNPMIAGRTVTWTTSAGTLSDKTLTDANGISTAILTVPNNSSNITVRAKGISADPGQAIIIPVTANESTSKITTLTTNTTSIVANGVTTMTLTATIKDANNNAGSGFVVNWATTAGTLASTTSIANASGVATVILTSNTTPQSVTLTAKGNVTDVGINKVVTFKP